MLHHWHQREEQCSINGSEWEEECSSTGCQLEVEYPIFGWSIGGRMPKCWQSAGVRMPKCLCQWEEQSPPPMLPIPGQLQEKMLLPWKSTERRILICWCQCVGEFSIIDIGGRKHAPALLSVGVGGRKPQNWWPVGGGMPQVWCQREEECSILSGQWEEEGSSTGCQLEIQYPILGWSIGGRIPKCWCLEGGRKTHAWWPVVRMPQHW